MKDFFAIFISAGMASLPAALAYAIYESVANSFNFFPSAFFLAGVFACAHALILGVPAALALKHTRLFRPIPMPVAGAAAGALPLAVFTMLSPPNYWQNPLLMFGSFTLLGAVGGLAFYFTHQASSPNNSFKPKPLRGSA